MITNQGKTVIKQYFGGQTFRLGQAIALGVGTTPAAVTDTKLDYEAVRAQITSINPDVDNDRVVFKASIAPGQVSAIHEIGLFQNFLSSVRDKIIPLTGSNRSPWTGGTEVATFARVGTTTLKVDMAANATTTAALTGTLQNLSDFTGSDGIAVAFQATTNIAAVRVRLGTDAANYFEYTFNTPTAGYNVRRAVRSAGAVVGAPDWGVINYIAVRPTATAAGAGSVYFDSITIEDNTTTPDNALVARTVLTTPVVVDGSIPTDIEFSLRIAV